MTQRTFINLLASLLLGCGSSETPNTQTLIAQKDVVGLRAKQAGSTYPIGKRQVHGLLVTLEIGLAR